MKIYYEKGDRVQVISDHQELREVLLTSFSDEKGMDKILNDISGTTGMVFAVTPNEGHKEVLYQKDGSQHTWKVPVGVFNKRISLQEFQKKLYVLSESEFIKCWSQPFKK